MNVSRQQLKRYAEALQMWCSRRYDTKDIADHVGVHESVVLRWISHYRDLMLGHAVA